MELRMRRILLGCVSMLALAAMSCGGDDPATVYADIQWAVRCGEFGMCSGLPDRDICGLDGATTNCETMEPARYDIRCTANASDGMYVLTIRARDTVDSEDVYGVSIRGLTVNQGGGMPVGSACSFQVEEGGNLFEGACGASPMTTDVQPCHIPNVSITDTAQGPTVSFTVMCTDLPSEADAMRKREVTGPGGPSMPATFMITSCSGL
jgi:hypothetical protein